MKHNILIDGNFLGFAGMSATRLSAGSKDTQAIFSVIRKIHKIVSDHLDSQIIVLWDGRSFRKDLYVEYKANREKTEKQVEARSDYYEQKQQIMKGLSLLGVRQLWATNMEADDMAAILSKALVEKGDVITLITADHDWQQLVNGSVTWVDPVNNKRCTFHNFKEQTGYKDVKQFIEAKCILGDTGDNIFGIHGVGKKTLDKVYERYDSFISFIMEGSVPRLEKWPKMPKVLRELDLKDALLTINTNRALVDLYSPARPEIDKLIDNKGKLDEEGFTDFCYENAFLSITSRMEKFILPFKENIYVSK